MTFPGSAVWSPSLRGNSLGLKVTSLIAKQTIWRRVGGGSSGSRVAVGGGGYLGLALYGVWQLADLAGPLVLSRSMESQLLV